MINMTHNNHLEYDIGGRLFGERVNSYEKYTVRLTKPVDMDYYIRTNYYKELSRVSELIYDDYNTDDFALFISGGTDSEIVLRGFLSIGVKPRCYIIRFKDGYNIQDVVEAEVLCAKFNVPLTYIDFDVKEFYYSGEASEFAKTIQCSQLTYLIIYKNILKIGLPAIMGGEALLKKGIPNNPNEWYYCIRENEDASAMRFSLKYNIPLVNEFFSYTPEFLLIWLENPDIVRLTTNSIMGKLSSVSTKNAVLSGLVPGLPKRIKTHGFEKLLGFNFEAYRGLSPNLIQRLEPSLDGISIQEAIKQLKGIE